MSGMQSTDDSIQNELMRKSLIDADQSVGRGAVWVEKVGIVKALVKHLRQRIITGELAPGEKIIEGQLSSSLGISRAPLREALRVLEYEGLVKNVPRKGSHVTGISVRDFEEIYHIREMIELYAIDLMREKNIRDFPRLVPVLEEAAAVTIPSQEDPPTRKLTVLSNSRMYHYRLVEATGNRKLRVFYRTIYYSIERYQFLYAFSSDLKDDGFDEHKEVFELLSHGKYAKAKKLLKEHIDFFSQKIMRKMQELEENTAQRAGG